MRKLSALLALVSLVLISVASAEWRIVSAEKEPLEGSKSPEHRHIILQNHDGADATFELCIFTSDRSKLRVIDNPNGNETLANAVQKKNWVAGINGGYFDPNFKPIGLRVIDEATVSPLIRGHLMTGVITSSDRGIEIVRVGEFSRRRKLDAALECGPMLIDLGVRVRGLDDSRNARRSFVFTARGGIAGFGVSTDLTLARLADALANISNDFKIWRAMNLDGGSSTAFWFQRNGKEAVSISEEKSVRDFLCLTSR